jgi:hypothetical protein
VAMKKGVWDEGASLLGQVHDLAALDDGKRNVRDIQMMYLSFDVSDDHIIESLLKAGFTQADSTNRRWMTTIKGQTSNPGKRNSYIIEVVTPRKVERPNQHSDYPSHAAMPV